MSNLKTNTDFLEFLEKCANRDKEAWNAFVEKYGNLIYNYILRTLKRYNYFFQNDEVDEIYDRIFLALLDKKCRRLRNFRGQNERSFGAYLREISFHIWRGAIQVQPGGLQQGAGRPNVGALGPRWKAMALCTVPANMRSIRRGHGQGQRFRDHSGNCT